MSRIANKIDYRVDRDSTSLDMRKRSFRVTDDENVMIKELQDELGLTLRDLIAHLVTAKYNEVKNDQLSFFTK